MQAVMRRNPQCLADPQFRALDAVGVAQFIETDVVLVGDAAERLATSHLVGLIIRRAVALGPGGVVVALDLARFVEPLLHGLLRRLEERRGGIACVRRCRSRWSAIHYKKKKKHKYNTE